MEEKTQYETHQDTSGLMGDTMSKLSEKKQATIVHLLDGKDIAKTARAVGLGRSTIHTWLKYDLVFQQAKLEEKARRRSNHKGTADEAESFSEVQDIPLLSPGGIRARLELRDRLILQDLAERDTNRSVLIRLLETSIKQANDYLGKVLPDEAAQDLVEQRATKYRQDVSEVLFKLLDSLPNREWHFDYFLRQLDCIDLQNGILRDEVFKQS